MGLEPERAQINV